MRITESQLRTIVKRMISEQTVGANVSLQTPAQSVDQEPPVDRTFQLHIDDFAEAMYKSASGGVEKARSVAKQIRDYVKQYDVPFDLVIDSFIYGGVDDADAESFTFDIMSKRY